VPGLSIKVLSDVGDGFTDVVIGYIGVNYLVEIKNGSCLTPPQKNFHGIGGDRPDLEWKGQKAVANSLEEVFDIIGVRNF
jgi:hypothetical protein